MPSGHALPFAHLLFWLHVARIVCSSLQQLSKIAACLLFTLIFRLLAWQC